jgi:hypothetical protein
MKVKKKMRGALHSDLFRVAPLEIRARVFSETSHLDRARRSYIQLDAGSDDSVADTSDAARV